MISVTHTQNLNPSAKSPPWGPQANLSTLGTRALQQDAKAYRHQVWFHATLCPTVLWHLRGLFYIHRDPLTFPLSWENLPPARRSRCNLHTGCGHSREWPADPRPTVPAQGLRASGSFYRPKGSAQQPVFQNETRNQV